MPHALVTGASGFIDGHLVRRLHEDGKRITCLVRQSSRRSQLQSYDPEFAIGDVTDPDSLASAVASVDVVYHLAVTTKCLHPRELERVKVDGVRNIARACADCSNPPNLILVSSLAAAGPTNANRLRLESDKPTPVSHYGHSKLAGEYEALRR
jgi:dihydroflavonol-4-reductase